MMPQSKCIMEVLILARNSILEKASIWNWARNWTPSPLTRLSGKEMWSLQQICFVVQLMRAQLQNLFSYKKDHTSHLLNEFSFGARIPQMRWPLLAEICTKSAPLHNKFESITNLNFCPIIYTPWWQQQGRDREAPYLPPQKEALFKHKCGLAYHSYSLLEVKLTSGYIFTVFQKIIIIRSMGHLAMVNCW